MSEDRYYVQSEKVRGEPRHYSVRDRTKKTTGHRKDHVSVYGTFSKVTAETIRDRLNRGGHIPSITRKEKTPNV